MASIDSPLGNTQVQGRPAPHYTVSDESGGQQQPQQFASSNFDEPPRQSPQPTKYPQQSQQSQQPQQHYSSNNMSADDVMAMRDRLIAERQGQHQQGQTIGSDRRRLELLIGIGREYKDIELETPSGRVVFKIQTIKAKERQHVGKMLDSLYKQKTNVALHDVRNTTLAYVIHSVDGILLDSLLNCEGMHDDDRYHVREGFIREMDDNISLFLFKNFEMLDEGAKTKYRMDTEEGVKEVAEAISKSK